MTKQQLPLKTKIHALAVCIFAFAVSFLPLILDLIFGNFHNDVLSAIDILLPVIGVVALVWMVVKLWPIKRD